MGSFRKKASILTGLLVTVAVFVRVARDGVEVTAELDELRRIGDKIEFGIRVEHLGVLAVKPSCECVTLSQGSREWVRGTVDCTRVPSGVLPGVFLVLPGGRRFFIATPCD